MAGFADPNDVISTNPYLQLPQLPQQAPDKWTVLGNLLMGAGAGISQADASGRGWLSGVAPGLLMGTQLIGQQQRQQEADALKRYQIGIALQGLHDKQEERRLARQGLQTWVDRNDPDKAQSPLFNLQPNPIRMAPDSYDGRTAGLEGGTKNGGMIFNELGSGAFGPYQFMPDTYAGVRRNNPQLNLPADMTQATREQWDQAHGVLKAENAAGLKAAGIEPTPDNLYLAHRFGVGGATAVHRADPNKPLAEILPIDWQRQNPDMRGQTAGGFRRLAGERMRGVGVPYEAPQNAQPTQYALQPDALPSFESDPVMSMLPRGSGRFMPGVLPNSDVAPSVTAPVMPQPQAGPAATAEPAAGVTPVQYQPPAQPRMAGNQEPPPQPPQVPRPILPRADMVEIFDLSRTPGMTPQKLEAEKQKRIHDLWKRNQDAADKAWQQQWDTWKFKRGQDAKDAWEPLDPKNAQMYPGLDPNKPYLRNKVTGDIKLVGGNQTTVNVDTKTENEFGKEMGKMDAKRFGEIIEAERTMSDMASKLGFAMDQFRQTYTGPGAETANYLNRILGAAGFEEAGKKANAADAAMAVISQMKPHMRASGSGASSDKDMDMFARALPNIINLEGGNERIVAVFQRMADRATRIRELAQEHSEGGRIPLTRTGFDAEVKKLGDLFTPEERKELQELGKAKAAPKPPPPGRSLADILGGAEQNRSPMPGPAARTPLDQIFGSSP